MRERIERIMVSLTLWLAALPATGIAAQDKATYPEPSQTLDEIHLFCPFWNSGTVYGESLFFAQEAEGQPPAANLLLPPEKSISLRSANGEKVYVEGGDFTIRPGSRRIELTKDSRIPFRCRCDLFPKKGQPNAIPYKVGDPETFLSFGNGHLFHDQQVAATYSCRSNSWGGYVPKFAGRDLPRTVLKLRAKRPLMICLSGDSISQGYNASGYTKAAPLQPAYGELVAMGLQQIYGSQVTLKNFAVAGWNAGQGARTVGQVIEAKPDLVIIAYGMNDVGARNPEQYKKDVGSIVASVRTANPEAEFVLVSSMLGNFEWQHTPREMFPKYRDALASLCGPGIVLADMTALWTDLRDLQEPLRLDRQRRQPSQRLRPSPVRPSDSQPAGARFRTGSMRERQEPAGGRGTAPWFRLCEVPPQTERRSFEYTDPGPSSTEATVDRRLADAIPTRFPRLAPVPRQSVPDCRHWMGRGAAGQVRGQSIV